MLAVEREGLQRFTTSSVRLGSLTAPPLAVALFISRPVGVGLEAVAGPALAGEREAEIRECLLAAWLLDCALQSSRRRLYHRLAVVGSRSTTDEWGFLRINR